MYPWAFPHFWNLLSFFLWYLCQISSVCLHKFILNPLLLLSATDVWPIWNYINGFLNFLASSCLRPLGSHSRGMEERRKKVGCLLPNYPSGCITSPFFCPLGLLLLALGYYRILCGFIDPTPTFVNSHFVNKRSLNYYNLSVVFIPVGLNIL